MGLTFSLYKMQTEHMCQYMNIFANANEFFLLFRFALNI
jgi:hypothetical protein